MYVPTIAVIVVLRYYLVQRRRPAETSRSSPALAVLGALFIAAQFYGTMPVPEAEFVDLSAEPDGRSVADRSAELQLYLVPAALQGESAIPGSACHSTWLGVPVFALLIWLHAPLWRYFRRPDPALAERSASPRRHRCDRRREPRLSHHVRDRVRLFAVDFELGGLHVPDPACGEDAAGVADWRRYRPDDRKTTIFGWIVTLIPRVGIVRPF